MAFESDDGYVPDTSGFAVFWLLKAGDAADWVRMWSGDADFRLPSDTIDTTGGLYYSTDFPLGLPTLSQAVNGASGTLEFGLNGVSQTAMRLAGADRELVTGSLIHIGIVDLDKYSAPIGSVDWHFFCVAGTPSQAKDGRGESPIWSISIPATTGFYERNDNTQLAVWSATSQEVRSPGDLGLSYIAKMSQGMVVAWP